MRVVNIVITDKGRNPAAVDLTLNKVYTAFRSEVGEFVNGCVNEFTYYELVDDVGFRCGIYKNWLGIALHEVP
ncbi:hypothetical protein VKV295_orf011 [Klebsiella phage VKV295]|nr:hypothetical protein VKV295_orf011 [Klebsiella phage VKV295]